MPVLGAGGQPPRAALCQCWARGMTSQRYSDLSTEELDRLIDIEERRMGREQGPRRR